MLSTATLKRGLHKGLFTLWEMTKIVIPVYVAVTFFKYTPVLDWIIKACAPVMGLFGLPGEAAVPLVLGNVLNLYAAIGALTSLPLAPREITILAIMLLISHNLLVESAVSGRTGVNGLVMGGFRLGLSFLCGILLNLFW